MAGTYEVKEQEQVNEIGPNGHAQTVMRVTIASKANGTVATISVPLTEYTTDKVNEVASARIATIDAVSEL